MKRSLFSAALLITLAAPVFAASPSTGGKDGGVTIVVSCDRGPMTAVVWDQPTPAFIDSLVAAGHGHADAMAIGLRICRDKTLIGAPDALTSTLRRVHEAAR